MLQEFVDLQDKSVVEHLRFNSVEVLIVFPGGKFDFIIGAFLFIHVSTHIYDRLCRYVATDFLFFQIAFDVRVGDPVGRNEIFFKACINFS